MPTTRTAPAATARPRVEELETRLAPAVTVRLDFSYDRDGFFSDPTRRAALQEVADGIASRLGDGLAALTPSGSNTWQANFYNPVSGSTVTLTNPVIGRDEVVVFVAGAPIGTSELGLATTGGFSASGSRLWLDTVRGRGQPGALGSARTDYSTWGGMVTFDSRTNWNFGSGPPTASQFDFQSVANHELMHIFGFGLGEAAFTRHVGGGTFNGPNVVATAGGPVPMVGDPPDHWAPGTRFGGAESPMLPSLTPGTKRTLTAVDYAALADIGWEVAGAPVSTVTSPAAPAEPVYAEAPPPPTDELRFAVGTTPGVTWYGSGGQVVYASAPFGGSAGGVRVATGDITGDGNLDLVAGTGPGQPAKVAVYDGRTGERLAEFAPFESGFEGGVFLATGDFTGDGRADIVVTPDQTGGAIVAVYSGAAAINGRAAEVARFFGIADSTFRGGARPAAGDVNRDGVADLVIAAGYGGGPRVAVFDGSGVRFGNPDRLAHDFFAFEPELRNGAYVAVLDVNGDGYGEVVAGAGPGGAPRVTAYSGRQLRDDNLSVVANFFAGPTSNRGGVRVAATDVTLDGRTDLVTGSGSGGLIGIYDARTLPEANPGALASLALPGELPDGVYVG